MKRYLLWSIKEAIFTFSKESERASWALNKYPMSFEFNPETSDDSAKSIMPSPESQYFSLNTENSNLVIKHVNGSISVSAQVCFTADLKDALSEEEFDEWSSEKGGWACATISADNVDAYISEDSGGNLTFSA